MKLTHEDLFKTFSQRADWTSDIIDQGFATRMGVAEETITDCNLLEIQGRHAKHISSYKFSRREEGATSGADWLWFFGEPGCWICLLVQAKIINPVTGNCHYLDYKKGEQRRKLLAYARRHRFVPRYCIYSRISPTFQPLPRVVCPELYSVPAKQWGCAIVTPSRVRRLVSKKEKKHFDVLAESIPWSYLFAGSAAKAGYRLGEYMANAIADAEELASRGRFAKRPRALTLDTNLPRGKTDPRKLLHTELPNIVLSLLRGKTKRSKVPLGGVSIVSAVPTRELERVQLALPSPESLDGMHILHTGRNVRASDHL